MCERDPAPMRRPSIAAAALALTLFACGEGEESTSEGQPSLPNAASLIPTAPAPAPSPTPTPGTTTDPEPWPATPGGGGGSGGAGGGGGGTASSCGEPSPPAISRVRVNLHTSNGTRMTLDATPLVGPDVAYCQRIGFTDGRSFCPVRTEGSPERTVCEAALVGRAADTGRIGPTWSVDGRRCDGEGDTGSCANHADNQFLVHAWGSGTFRACVASGACGELAIP